MYLSSCVFISLLMIADGFTLKGSSGPLVVPLGGSVLLPCSVDSLLSIDDLEVEWRRSDSQALIHLYQDGDVHSESQHQDYHDRAHFFTDDIKHGNFSILIENVTAEDEGQYTCKVYIGQESEETVVDVSLKHVGLSALHIIVLILCIAACGSALLICFLIYCRPNTGFRVEGFYFCEGSVFLPCLIDPQLMRDDLKVKWRRSGLKSPVCVYEDKTETQHQDYHDRAHFITDDIKHGNLSLLLKNVRKEDKGEYTCEVNCDQRSVFSFSVDLECDEDGDFSVEYSCDLVVPLGSSVVLPCVFNDHLSGKIKKVEWRKSDSESPVFVYEDGEERQNDRAHFITDDIKHGNFSILMNNVTAEDEGEYTCKIYNIQRCAFSCSTELVPRLLDTGVRLQMLLVFCPNIIMFFAFVLWGVSEGSVNETIFCCALYIVRPLMLLFAAPYVEQFKDNIKTWILNYSYDTEYFLFSAVLYSVLFYSAWMKGLSFAGFEGIMIIVLFGLVLLFSLFYIIFLLGGVSGKLSQRIIKIFDALADLFFDVLPSLQFILLFYAFGSARGGLFIVAVLPVILTATNYDWDFTCGKRMGCSPLVRRSVWFTVIILTTAVMMFFYILVLENEKDRVGWACMIGFLQALWAVFNYFWSFKDKDFPRLLTVYVFGSVGAVLISAVALMTELILKTFNGEGLVGDLRIVVFSCEILFIGSVVILLTFAPSIKPCLQSCQTRARSRTQDKTSDQNAAETPAAGSNQNTTGSHERNPLLNTQPDSVISQT